MESSDSVAKLCEVCSKLDIQQLTYPLYPCRNPLPCSVPPTGWGQDFRFPLGSIDEVKSRRFTCDLCRLIAEGLDKEPPDLNGQCVIRDNEKFCSFRLPEYVKAQDPSITHFHITQLSVLVDPPTENEIHGPFLPWELKERDPQLSDYILNLQVSQNQVLSKLILNSEIKAKARSCVKAGDPTMASPQTEQQFLDTVGGRHVAAEVDLQLIRAWLHQCESKHGKDCMPSLRLSVERDRAPTFQPTFVVDVIHSCLVDTPSQCRYVALSYVWGTARVFTHLLENTQDIRKTSSLRSLPIPATIRDAMTLVHAIGERYLWVDSLCIIQNDLKMQQTEISRMGSIFSKALFTIVAAAGDHANSGLPGVERESRERVQKILRFANSELLTVIDIRKTQSGIDDTIWASRAWTFQERVLSNRVLVFSESQVYWSCRSASHSEERAFEEIQDIDRLHLSFPQKPATDCLSWEPLEPSKYCDIYHGLLSGYRQRRLTYDTDMLNTFNGVSEILAALQDDTFLWGLPESLFSYVMTWSFIGHSARNYINLSVFDSNGSKEMIPIPSWSWAAWSGEDPNNLPWFHGRHSTGHVRPVIQFDIVDGKHRLVRIKERPYQSHPDDPIRALWKPEQPHQLQSPTQHSLLQIGHLHFWTSLANVKAIRRWEYQGLDAVQYTLFPPPDFQPDTNPTPYSPEIVHQDFIVIAAGDFQTLILLAIEWRDGVAYRVGKTEVEEEEWLRVENRQWRLIILG